MRKRFHHTEEDATSMGGWLFADSFLALMVIFLATISFVPSLGGSVSNGSNIGNIGGSNYVRGLNLVYETFDSGVILADIAKYEKSEGISLGAEVMYAKITGGYLKGQESETDGRFRAILFAAQIKKANLKAFANTKIDLGANSNLNPQQIVLRLTFAG